MVKQSKRRKVQPRDAVPAAGPSQSGSSQSGSSQSGSSQSGSSQSGSSYILCDAGPLIAIVDRKQNQHSACRTVLETCLQQTPALTLLTTWPCLTEAMYFLGKRGGWPLQNQLAAFVRQQVVQIYPFSPEDALYDRLFALMEKYKDRPMDLADATLVLLAEATGLREILTLDSDFQVYRIHQHETFEILP